MTLWAPMSKNPLPLHNSIQKKKTAKQTKKEKPTREFSSPLQPLTVGGSICTCAKANRNAAEILRIRWSDTTDCAGIASYRFWAHLPAGPIPMKHHCTFKLALKRGKKNKTEEKKKKRGNCGLSKAPVLPLEQYPNSLSRFPKSKTGKRWRKHAGERCFCL